MSNHVIIPHIEIELLNYTITGVDCRVITIKLNYSFKSDKYKVF